MASKAHTTIDAATGCAVVTIFHLDTDSFSRSVAPAATRAWRALPRATQIANRYRETTFAWDSSGRECVSTVVFGPSFDIARTVLDQIVAGHRSVGASL